MSLTTETTPETTPEAVPISPLPLGRLCLVRPDQEAEAVVARMGHWNSALKPWDCYETWLMQGVCQQTFHTERLHQEEIVLRHAQAQRAELSWDEDRRGEAEMLSHGLMRHPLLVVPKLRRTKHGCELLAERWETLRATAEARGDWSAPNRLLALNLLGVPPELRDAVTPLDVPAGTSIQSHLVALAQEQVHRHRNLAANLTPIDETEREAARVGLAPATPELNAVRKEERTTERRLAWYRAAFKTSRPDVRPPDRGDLPAYIPPKSRARTDEELDNTEPPYQDATDLPPKPKSRRRRA